MTQDGPILQFGLFLSVPYKQWGLFAINDNTGGTKVTVALPIKMTKMVAGAINAIADQQMSINCDGMHATINKGIDDKFTRSGEWLILGF